MNLHDGVNGVYLTVTPLGTHTPCKIAGFHTWMDPPGSAGDMKGKAMYDS